MLTFEPESNILRNYGFKPSLMVGPVGWRSAVIRSSTCRGRGEEAWWIIYPKGKAIWQQEIKHTNTGRWEDDRDLIKDFEELIGLDLRPAIDLLPAWVCNCPLKNGIIPYLKTKACVPYWAEMGHTLSRIIVKIKTSLSKVHGSYEWIILNFTANSLPDLFCSVTNEHQGCLQAKVGRRTYNHKPIRWGENS